MCHPELGMKILEEVAEHVAERRQGRGLAEARRAQHDDGARARPQGAGGEESPAEERDDRPAEPADETAAQDTPRKTADTGTAGDEQRRRRCRR